MRYSYNTLLMSLSALLNICLFCVSFLGGFWLSDFSPYYGSCFSPYLHVWSYLIGCWTMFNFFLGAAYFFLQIFLTFALEYSSVYLDAVWYFSGLALILWPRAVLSLKFIIPHYWGKIFLSTQCPMTYEFFSLAGGNRHCFQPCVRTRYSSLSSFQIALSSTVGSLLPCIQWPVPAKYSKKTSCICSGFSLCRAHSAGLCLANSIILVSPVLQLHLLNSESPPTPSVFPFAACKPSHGSK